MFITLSLWEMLITLKFGIEIKLFKKTIFVIDGIIRVLFQETTYFKKSFATVFDDVNILIIGHITNNEIWYW